MELLYWGKGGREKLLRLLEINWSFRPMRSLEIHCNFRLMRSLKINKNFRPMRSLEINYFFRPMRWLEIIYFFRLWKKLNWIVKTTLQCRRLDHRSVVATEFFFRTVQGQCWVRVYHLQSPGFDSLFPIT